MCGDDPSAGNKAMGGEALVSIIGKSRQKSYLYNGVARVPIGLALKCHAET
jgi:hypothetical protein